MRSSNSVQCRMLTKAWWEVMHGLKWRKAWWTAWSRRPSHSPKKAASLRTPSSTCSQMHTAQEKNRKDEKAMHSCRSMSSFGLHRCGGVVCAAGVPQWVNRSSLERTGKEEKMHFGQSSWLNAGRFVWELVKHQTRTYAQGSEDRQTQVTS